MKIPVDIHTHQLSVVPGEAIVNCYPETFAPHEGCWYSVGIHPWHLMLSADQGEQDDRRKILAELVNHSQVLAIGEAGLDKLADAPMAMQIEFFEHQARLAMEVDKPLIIHLVKAADELLKLKHTLRPANPWIIHGFRGKAAMAQEYLRHGFYLSFGEKYQEEVLRLTPVERLFIETDESVIPVVELYERAAHLRGVTGDELLESVRQNIRKAFFKL
ncbi:TatD family hydrolase [Bacteroides sp.]|uniref:TatD family hydrolase n=1 Tax=Bacteroides sp. TaxID=29523 RepID=UPI0026268A1C|nr:TatD family hydrolase [Bacteroides sp.]